MGILITRIPLFLSWQNRFLKFPLIKSDFRDEFRLYYEVIPVIRYFLDSKIIVNSNRIFDSLSRFYSNKN